MASNYSIIHKGSQWSILNRTLWKAVQHQRPIEFLNEMKVLCKLQVLIPRKSISFGVPIVGNRTVP